MGRLEFPPNLRDIRCGPFPKPLCPVLVVSSASATRKQCAPGANAPRDRGRSRATGFLCCLQSKPSDAVLVEILSENGKVWRNSTLLAKKGQKSPFADVHTITFY
jgi:hypothetical protein